MNLGGSAEQNKYAESDSISAYHVKSAVLSKTYGEQARVTGSARVMGSTRVLGYNKVNLLQQLAVSPTRASSQGKTQDGEKKAKTTIKTMFYQLWNLLHRRLEL